MGISINTNVAATRSGMYLASNHANLQKSLDRLSSGRRITEPADDAGGLAVSMKLEHSSTMLQAVSRNISNAVSLLQVQDGILKSAADIVTRVGELKAMFDDVTKSTADGDLYEAELADLAAQITAMHTNSTFNGINLFATGGATLTVNLDDVSATTFNINTPDLSGATNVAEIITASTAGAGGGGSLADADLTTQQISDALEEVAALRAGNGGEVRRLQYSQANVDTQVTNLIAANGRIVDVDIAHETTNLAKQQVLVQASAAMTAQANMSNDVALLLLQ